MRRWRAELDKSPEVYKRGSQLVINNPVLARQLLSKPREAYEPRVLLSTSSTEKTAHQVKSLTFDVERFVSSVLSDDSHPRVRVLKSVLEELAPVVPRIKERMTTYIDGAMHSSVAPSVRIDLAYELRKESRNLQGVPDDALAFIDFIQAAAGTLSTSLAWLIRAVQSKEVADHQPAELVRTVLQNRPPAWFVFRTASEPLTVSGIDVPSGGRLLFPIGFLAERDRTSMGMLFGYGPSACPGRVPALRILIDAVPAIRAMPQLGHPNRVWSTSPIYSPVIRFRQSQ